MNAHLLLMAGFDHTVWEKDGLGGSPTPPPHSHSHPLIFPQSDQSSEPLITRNQRSEPVPVGLDVACTTVDQCIWAEQISGPERDRGKLPHWVIKNRGHARGSC